MVCEDRNSVPTILNRFKDRSSASFGNVNEKNFDGHLILTDMCAPKPIPSKCQRMWMTDSENARNPYFKTNERVIAVEVKVER